MITTHEELRAAVEVEETSYLWVKGDTPPFTPRLVDKVFGDGRRLLALSTLNQRPRYWVIRICSTWTGWGWETVPEVEGAPEISEMVEDLLQAIEGQFGRYDFEEVCREAKQAGEPEPDWPEDVFPECRAEGGCQWGVYFWPDLVRESLRPSNLPVAQPAADGGAT